MKLLLELVFLFLIQTTVFGQNKSSIDGYLDKLIKNLDIEKGSISNENYDLMKKLIETEIKQKYDDTLQLYGTPQNFKTFTQDNLTTYYQVAPLNYGHDVLFIWVIKDDKQWKLYSHYEKSVEENTTFNYNSKNGFDLFISPSFCVYGKPQIMNWKRIDFTLSDNKYFQVYKWCDKMNDSTNSCIHSTMNSKFFPEITNLQKQMSVAISKTKYPEQIQELIDSFQTLIENKRQEIISNHGQEIILTVSKLIFKDIDADGEQEVFWFSISNQTLIDFKVYHLTSTGLTETESKNYIVKLKLTKEFEDLNNLANLK